MSRASTLVIAALALLLANPLWSQEKDQKKGKAPADAAADAFFALRNDGKAPITAERLQQLAKAGLDYICAYPTHGRVVMTIGSLTSFGPSIRDKKLAPMRDYWHSILNYEISSRRFQPSATEDTRLALASLGASVAAATTRLAPTRENLQDWRAKIDALAKMPGSDRFLSGNEREFLMFIVQNNAKNGEALATKLLEHPDKRVADMARDELKFMQLKKAPLDLKFTALDGKDFDAAKFRGKAVVLYCWTTGYNQAAADVATLRQIYKEHKGDGLEIVTVCGDKEEDREKVLKFVKDNKLAWPVLFDGKGRNGEAADRLAVHNFPTLHIFGKDGLLAVPNVRMNRVQPEVRRILGIKGN